MKLEIRDTKTGERFSVDPAEDRVIIRTADGEKVKIHPTVIRSFVGIGQRFDGTTLRGSRTLERTR